MPTYEERAKVFWQSLSPADKKRIHGFLTIDGSASWRFDADKVAKLCESHPEIPFALRAMIPTDKRKAGPSENSDNCLARAAQVFQHAEAVARTVPNRFGEAVPEDAYKQIQSGLVQGRGRGLRGWNAVPLATIMQIIDLYAFNTTITPPDSDETLEKEPREEKLKIFWEAAKRWGAPRDCGRLQLLLSTIERELPANLKPTIKEEDTLAERAEELVAYFRGDLENRRTNADHVLRQLEDATAANDISYLENKLSILNRRMRYICEKLQVQEARAKYLRWGGRPPGHYDPFDELQKGILDFEAEHDEATIPQD